MWRDIAARLRDDPSAAEDVPDLAIARRLLPSATRAVPNQLGGTEATAPSASSTPRPPDATRPR